MKITLANTKPSKSLLNLVCQSYSQLIISFNKHIHMHQFNGPTIEEGLFRNQPIYIGRSNVQ